MPNDHQGDPWRDSTYRGFADAAGQAQRPSPRPRRADGRALLVGGVAAALALGLALGLLARPQLKVSRNPPAATAAPAQAPSAPAAQVPIAIAPTPAPELPKARPLQVLPDQPAARAPRAKPVEPAEPAAEAAAPTPAPLARAETPAPAAPAWRTEPDCAGRAGAAQMVCSDPELSAADREMARAYRRALDAGVPAEDLRQEQDDWLAIREDAARHSRRALLSVYDQRLRELDAMADDSGEDEDGGAD
jgi:uncharacterized protein YecT (DUF1311 family)